MTIYRNSRLGCHGNERKNKHLILKIKSEAKLEGNRLWKLPVILMSKNKTLKYDQGVDEGGKITNNIKSPSPQNYRRSQNMGILSLWDLFAITFQVSERVSKRPSSTGTSGCHFWNLDPSELSHLIVLKSLLVFLYLSTQWHQQPPSQWDQINLINSFSSFCLA